MKQHSKKPETESELSSQYTAWRRLCGRTLLLQMVKDIPDIDDSSSETRAPNWSVAFLSAQRSFRGERVGRVFPRLKCLRTHYGRHCEPFSGQKCTIFQEFAYTPAVIPWDPCSGKERPPERRDFWTQTPISAWLASVSIVPVIRRKTTVSAIFPYLLSFCNLGAFRKQNKRITIR